MSHGEAPPSARDQENAREQSLALQAIVACNASIRTFKIYASDNQAVNRPLENLTAAIEGLLETRASASLLVVEGMFYVGDSRVRVTSAQQSISDELAGEFERRNIGGLKFAKRPERAHLMALFEAMRKFETGGADAAQAIRDALAEARVDSVVVSKPLVVVTDQDQELPARMAQIYTEALRNAQGLLAQIRAKGVRPGSARAQRLVQELVDLSGDDPAMHLLVAGLRGSCHDVEAEHAVGVTVLSIAMGRRLDLERRELADLGMAAMFHDVGREHLGEHGAEDLEAHPVLAVRTLASRAQLSLCLMRQVVVAFQHHLGVSGTGEPRPRLRRMRQHLFAQIVQLANDFDDLTRGRHAPARSVDDALAQMTAEPPGRYHPDLLAVFVDLVGGGASEGACLALVPVEAHAP